MIIGFFVCFFKSREIFYIVLYLFVEEQQELDQEVEEEDQLNVSKRILFESSSEKEKDAEEKV
jgi:hypothetical protein